MAWTKVKRTLIYATIGFVAYKNLKREKLKRKRRWWVRPVYQDRDKFGYFETTFELLKEKDPDMFLKVTRMSVDKFNVLLTLVRSKLEKLSFRKPISPECRLFITLMYLAHGGARRIYCWKFRISSSTFGSIVYETCEGLWDELSSIYLAPPNNDEWIRIAKGFSNRWCLPNCLGAIDGKHINIVCPPNGGSQYFNYKGRHSIVLLAVCDANYCFSMVDIGAYGSQSDGGILAESVFGKLLLQNELPIPQSSTLDNSDISCPYFFVGDNAFPLRRNLMRPFPGQNLSPTQENFNKRISHARVTIENTFGILAARWRILRNDIHALPRNVDKIIKATVLLHNFLMLDKCASYCPQNYVDQLVSGELVQGEWRNDNPNLTGIGASRSHNATREAYNVRETLCNYLFD